MKALILMAGEGKRFKEKGYTFPKPLLDVAGKAMLQWTLNALPHDIDEYIFVAQQEHVEKYNLNKVFELLTDNRYKTIMLNGITEGAACSALAAKDLINNDEELIISNADQFMLYDRNNFNVMRKWSNADGIIFAFEAVHPKWSFLEFTSMSSCDCSYAVSRVVEKMTVSTTATVGVYYFSEGNKFVNAAEEMIRKNIRTNNEFYLAPAYNELISSNKSLVLPFWVDRMVPLGTPEDMEYAVLSGNLFRR